VANVELNSFQTGFTSYVMTGIDKPGMRICEVACGSGTHAEIAAMSLISKENKPVFVTADFSAEMVNMLG